MIDAQQWFGASIGACLFSLDLGSENCSYQASVYQDLDSTEPQNVIEVVGKHIVSNIQSYRQFAFIEGECSIAWRQGLKHDAASVMELSYNSQGVLENKLKETVDVEPEYVFPLLKGTDLFHGKLNSMRSVIVPQKFIGENTDQLKQNAPKLWSYLNQHLDYFLKRKSSIYKNRPSFSIFGIGDYSFSDYKVGISGLHKEPRFLVIPPIGDRPVMLDDTCYFIPCSSLEQANLLAGLLNSPECIAFIHSRIFLDAKRPITKKLLQCINLQALLDCVKSDAELFF
jgi:hypothetical protein